MATTLPDVRTIGARVLAEVERAVVGKRDTLELVLLGLLADGHVLIEDYPGLAKTLMARSFAQVAQMRFQRIQFTPDLVPSDVTGSSIYNQRDHEFEFRPGPIFANLLLADEINRAPPKTQAALLEAMQERQVTIEGVTHLLEPQRSLEHVHVSEPIGLYMVDLVAATRESPRLQVGASPRGTLALLKLARARAAVAGRDFVTPEDVKAVAVPALAHRLTLRPELWVQRVRGEDVVREALETVPTPAAEDVVPA